MPELPEVETVVRDLRPLLVGRRFTAVWAGHLALRRPWRPAWKKRLVGRLVEAVRRRGKWILLDLDDGGRLVVHLGMSGRLTVDFSLQERDKHHHLIFDLDEGENQLRFLDPRRFGGATLFPTDNALEAFFRASCLGREPHNLDPEYWRRCLAATSRGLKAMLLAQTTVAGVGNIYADEALFEARLHPARVASSLDERDADRLRRAIETVLNRAIKHGGADIGDGVIIGGEMQHKLRVYRRTGYPCPRCGTPIKRISLAGRSTHFCPGCQKNNELRPTGATKA